MAALYTTMQFTNEPSATPLADLVDGTNYALVEGGWSPAVAPRRASQLGGQSVYEDVEEEITVNVYGDTAAEALDNLANLTEIVDIATRWSQGENEYPVIFEVQPQGSDLAAPLQAVVTGGPARYGSLNLPVTFNDKLMVYTIENVRFRFTRRGEWLGEEETVTSAPVANPGMVAVSFGAATSIPSPVKVRLAGFTGGASPTIPRGYIALTNADGKLAKVEAEDAGIETSGNSTTATAADTARYASGTILTYTVTGTGGLARMWLGTSVLTPTAVDRFDRIAVFAVLENVDSLTYTFALRTTYTGGDYSDEILTTTIDANTGEFPALPQTVYLGAVPFDADTVSGIEVTPTSYTNTGTLRFDYFLLVGLSPSGRVLAVEDTRSPTAAAASLVIDHRLDSATHPRVVIVSDADLATPIERVDYRGDPVFMPTGARVSAFYIGNDPQYWVMLDEAAVTPAALDYTMHATRRRAYLVPQ